MAKRTADKKEPERKNPLLSTISIRKWEPDRETMRSIDKSMLRARGGADQEPDQWHKDYRYARR